MHNNINMIAVTGGPCGGKSTFLAGAFELLQSYGIHVFVIPEVATELIEAGINPKEIGMINFEKIILKRQLEKEDVLILTANKKVKKSPVVIFCDRGALDCAAYVDREVFTEIVREMGYSITDLMNRYKMVVHLVTAASGAEKFYTLENNKARSEGIEEARELDKKTNQAWLGHPHHVVIDNSTEFDAKILRALQTLTRGLNMPKPTEIERKFKVIDFNPNLIPQNAVSIEIEQTYLIGSKDLRVRAVYFDGQKSFFQTEKEKTDQLGVRFEIEKVINLAEYQKLCNEKRDPSFETIKKFRHMFFYCDKKFEVDVYVEPERLLGLVVMEVELPKIDEEIKFPPGWEIEEVTGQEKYDNYSLARKK